MAKSLRSKWRRKMRAVKRERYSKKELVRLKKTLGIEDTAEASSSSKPDAEMSEIINFTTVEEIKQKRKEKEEKDIMDESTIEDIKKFNPKTLRNENGAYPVWVHPRKIRKCKKTKEKTKKKSKGKVNKVTKE
ncbi:unnamed protein product [Phyllotreta striolata]|uniref:Protein LLP homolog n=1 Tax=Phyllotreta striolata TaxID=444603 RepID=A0A9N9TLB2_PHYSR|nr:unnamed protein product [Phyllotreta striolata]